MLTVITRAYFSVVNNVSIGKSSFSVLAVVNRLGVTS